MGPGELAAPGRTIELMWALGEKKSSHSNDDDNFTFLGKGVEFKGVVNFDGTVRIDGKLEG